MRNSAGLWTTRKSLVVPERAPYTGHRFPGSKRRTWNHRRQASFISEQDPQHRDWNLFVAPSRALPPDPFFDDVLYLFNGDFNGANQLLDLSSYAGVYGNPSNKFNTVALAPFVGQSSTRRIMNVAVANGAQLVSGGPPLGVFSFDSHNWSVEAWVRTETGAVPRLYLSGGEDMLLSGGQTFAVDLGRDISPEVFRFGARVVPTDLSPGIVAPADVYFPNAAYPYYDIWVFFGCYCNNGVVTTTLNGVQLAQAGAATGPVLRVLNALDEPMYGSASGAGVGTAGWSVFNLRFTANVCRQTVYPFSIPTTPFPLFGP